MMLHQKSETARYAFTDCAVRSSGGAVLKCSHTALNRSRPTVLIALPFGVPVDVARAAFEKFQARFNVVTWESRYVLNLDQTFSGDEKLAPIEHVMDMIHVLASLGIDTCYLIGYCSGAGIALLAARHYPEIFTELILVNGEYQLFRKGHVSTNYQRSIDSFLPQVAVSRQSASVIFSTMAEVSKASKAGEPSALEKQINLPFSQEEHLFRYAKNYMAYRDFDALNIVPQVTQRTFVVTGRMDEHSSMENSEAIFDCLRRAQKFVDDNADHYAFCRAGSLTLAVIGDYLRVLSMDA